MDCRVMIQVIRIFQNFINNYVNISSKSDISNTSTKSDKRILIMEDFGRDMGLALEGRRVVAEVLGFLKKLYKVSNLSFTT
jgi:hypothetical protein